MKQETKTIKEITKICGTPEEFVWEYINGASIKSDIERMKEYAKCIKKVESKLKKQL